MTKPLEPSFYQHEPREAADFKYSSSASATLDGGPSAVPIRLQRME
jgi:hypothetical protein